MAEAGWAAVIRRRMPAALLVAVIGSGVFLAMRHVMRGVIDEPSALVGCFAGAFGSSLAWYDEKRLAWMDNFLPAIGIVVVTLAVIGLGWGMDGLLRGRPQGGGELMGGVGSALFFGTIYTSWWLVPALTTVLWGLNAPGRFARRLEGRAPGVAAFAESLGRPESDVFVQAVYKALVEEAGRELERVRADDDLEDFWGIVDLDLDDVGVRAVELLPKGWSVELKGHHGFGRTPRMLIEFLASHVRQS